MCFYSKDKGRMKAMKHEIPLHVEVNKLIDGQIKE